MSQRTLFGFSRGLALATVLASASACNRTPSDLRKWQKSDHDHTSNPGAAQVEVSPNATSPFAVYGIDEVTVVAWERNCARCHGPSGAGDGPDGPVTRTRNLTDPVWQAGVTDASIAEVIRNGRGLMPAFQLPDATVTSLVRLVRLLDPRRRAEVTAHASAGASAGAAPPVAPAPRSAAPATGAVPGGAGGATPLSTAPGSSGGGAAVAVPRPLPEPHGPESATPAKALPSAAP